MTERKVWLITGASRGLGTEIARAALDAGHAVVATGRRPDTLAARFGDGHPTLLVTVLDVTTPGSVGAAVEAALVRFGRIDVLVNNAGYGLFGYFEELTPGQIEAQFATNVFGVLHVTRAVLPHMRAQRSGYLLTVSSVSGLVGGEGRSAYHASKFAVEGFLESIRAEVAPFGISSTLVEPGYLRTEFLGEGSLVYGEREQEIDDYAAASAVLRSSQEAKRGTEEGDPRKLAQLLVGFADAPAPPPRFLAGADAYELAVADLARREGEVSAGRELSLSIGFDG